MDLFRLGEPNIAVARFEMDGSEPERMEVVTVHNGFDEPLQVTRFVRVCAAPVVDSLETLGVQEDGLVMR